MVVSETWAWRGSSWLVENGKVGLGLICGGRFKGCYLWLFPGFGLM